MFNFVFLTIFCYSLVCENSISCKNIDVPLPVVTCIQNQDKGSVRYLNDGTDCCSARRQLYIIENINRTLCEKPQEIEVNKWKQYLEIQLNNNMFGGCNVKNQDLDKFICT